MGVGSARTNTPRGMHEHSKGTCRMEISPMTDDGNDATHGAATTNRHHARVETIPSRIDRAVARPSARLWNRSKLIPTPHVGSGTQRRTGSKGAWAALVGGMLVLVMASCSTSNTPSSYGPMTHDNFVEGCTRARQVLEICEKTYLSLSDPAGMPFEQFKQLDAELHRDPSAVPDDLQVVINAQIASMSRSSTTLDATAAGPILPPTSNP
jgi:hypothetical protein